MSWCMVWSTALTATPRPAQSNCGAPAPAATARRGGSHVQAARARGRPQGARGRRVSGGRGQAAAAAASHKDRAEAAGASGLPARNNALCPVFRRTQCLPGRGCCTSAPDHRLRRLSRMFVCWRWSSTPHETSKVLVVCGGHAGTFRGTLSPQLTCAMYLSVARRSHACPRTLLPHQRC